MKLLRAAAFAQARAGRYFYWKATIAIWLTAIIAGWFEIQYDLPLAMRIALSAVLLYINLVLCAARCRDAGIPTWVALYLLAPGIGLIYLIYWGTVESDPDASMSTESSR